MSSICTFTLTLSEASTSACSVHYATSDETATSAGSADYVSESGTCTFAPGQTTQTIVVPIVADPTASVAKAFSLILSAPVGLTLPQVASSECVISTDTPIISITAAAVSTAPTAAALNPLVASGNQFLDAVTSTKVRLRGTNWYGYDGTDLLVHGLYAGRSYKDVIDQFIALGFNTFRIPFCDDFIASGLVFNGDSGNQYVDPKANPDLIGLTPMQALDANVYYCSQVGMRILLDHHRISQTSIGGGDSGFGTDGWPSTNPETGTYLWGGSNTLRAYTPEGQWTTMWKALATHFTTDHTVPGIPGAGQYASNPGLRNVIVGFDPHNEPHNLTWSTWAGMCEALFAQVNTIAPDWMMFVEGVGASDDGSDTYWWGGYLKGAVARPVNLGSKQNKLAYNVHDYGQSVSSQPWLSSVQTSGGTIGTSIYPALPNQTVANYPDNLEAIFDANWGDIHWNGTAPVLVSEWGGGFGYDYNTGAADPLQVNGALEIQWGQKLVQYMNGVRNDGTSRLSGTDVGMSFTYFPINPEGGDPLGGLLLGVDYLTLQIGKINLLQPLLQD